MTLLYNSIQRVNEIRTYGNRANQKEMDTDEVLSMTVIIGLACICFCGIGAICYKIRVPTPHIKPSRSDPDFSTILDDAAGRNHSDTQDPIA